MCILAGRPSLERLRHQCPSSRRNQRTNTMPDKLPMHLSPRCGESPKGAGLISMKTKEERLTMRKIDYVIPRHVRWSDTI